MVVCRAAQRAAAAAAEADEKFAALIETPARKRQRIEAAGKTVKRVTFPSEGLEQARCSSPALLLEPSTTFLSATHPARAAGHHIA